MRRKGIRQGIRAVAVLLLCLQILFPVGSLDPALEVEAASKKVAFASSIQSEVMDAAAEAGASDKAKIGVANVKNYVSVRAKRKTSSEKLGVLYRGSAAYIVKTKGSWSYISSGDLEGWVKSKYLATGSKATKLAKKINPRVATVTATDLNIRRSKSTSSDIVATLYKGEKIIVLASTSSWLKVRVTSDTTGYIYKQYASVESGFYTGATAAQEDEKIERMIEAQEEREIAANTAAEDSGHWVSLGTFRTTAYCGCSKCNGKLCAGKTASGAVPRTGHTVAVDPSVIPLGSRIRLGKSSTVYVAEDTGVKNRVVDIFYGSHSSALRYGVKNLEVYIYQK